MYRRKKNDKYKKKDVGPKKNGQITAKTVMLIDHKGESKGEMETYIAMSKAKEVGLDLVEVGAKAVPPVCKIMDYSKYIYEQKKKLRKSKKTGKLKPMKEFRFTPVIDVGDSNTRIRRAHEFLAKGHNVRITMYRKGRQSQDQANATFDDILTNFDDYSSIEPEPKREGRNIFITYKPDGKSKETKQVKKDSHEEVAKDKSKGEKKAKAKVQTKRTAPPKDKKIKESKTKKASA